jgi:hypothetical protein
MKNIIKTLIVMLTSISLFASANAGELSVSGSAKATYNITSGMSSAGKGIGITNELNFTAAGELDNGYTWNYSMELDPAASTGTANNDDTQITMSTPYGTVGVFISEGGLDLEDAASQSTYARPTDAGDPSSGDGDNYNIDGYNSLQYHMPADMLPFGIVGKIAYAPTLDAGINSGNATGAAITNSTTTYGRTATSYQVKAAPLDGLSMGVSYLNFRGAVITGQEQHPESGAAFVSYATGPISVGYSQAAKAMMLADDASTGVEHYIQKNYSIAFQATDALSISYEMEKDEANYVNDATAEVTQESSAVQAAYTAGGATLSVHHGSYDDVGFVKTKEAQNTIIAVSLAF